MGATVGGNQNFNDETVVDSIFFNVGAVTPIDVAAANPQRCYIRIQNLSNSKSVWVRLRDASTGALVGSILLMPSMMGKDEFILGDGPGMFKGPVSVVAASGTANVAVTEF